MSAWWPWLALFLLGAYHGVNPGMGWLFAVALGLQEKSSRAVLRSLVPLGLGHVLSIALVVGALELARVTLPQFGVRLAAAVILFAFGLYKLLHAHHPRWVGMRVGARDLALWSFLMASAHGAGLMLVPILLGWPRQPAVHHMHHPAMLASMQPAAGLAPAFWLAPVAVHALGYLLITGLVALLVFQKLGLAALRRAWFNLDLFWAAALVLAGVLTLFA